MKMYGEELPGVKLIHNIIHSDIRGYFYETWKTSNDNMRGTYRQLNTAHSSINVIRGMHRQDQTKLVMPLVGKIFDVALEPETKKWCAYMLDENCALYIPPQYAHGYMVLSDKAIVQYIVDKPWNKELEENFKWDQYKIEWPLTVTPILSEKDK